VRHASATRSALAALLASLAAAAACAQTADDLFDDAILHEIRLVINPSDWERLRINFREDAYYPCHFRWRYQGRDLEIPDIGIRSRGSGSRSGVKPGLRVDFDRYEAGQRFLGLSALVLRNNTQDASLLHERLAMLLFRRLGLPAPRQAHARLYINNQYFGLYTIVEAINKQFLKRQFGEDDGHLYEYRWIEPYRFEYRGPDLARYVPAPFKPETHERNPNPAPLEAMMRTLNQASDAEFVSAMAEYLDLKQFLTHVAVENFLVETDGLLGYEGLNNFYLYRFERKNLSQLIAWDKSETFHSPDHDIFWNVKENVLVRRALQSPELRQAYLEALVRAAALAGGAGGWLDQEVERQYQQIRAAAREDVHKQCSTTLDSPQRTCTNEEFEEAVDWLRLFARERGQFVWKEAVTAGFQLSGAAPRIAEGGAVNAASGSPLLAPGSLASLYGQGFGTATAAADFLPLPTSLGEVSLLVNGREAPLLFVSPGQINFQAPWETPAGVTPIAVLVRGAVSNLIYVSLTPSAPGVFAVLHADGGPVGPARPAAAGDVLLLFANGLGPVTEKVPSGGASPAQPLALSLEAPTVTFGGVPGEVLFSGLAPGFVGLYQVNVRAPQGIPDGSATPLVVSAGGQPAPPVPIATR